MSALEIGFSIAGLALAIVVAMFGGYRWVVARIDRLSSELHGRINDVREKYVRRDDLDTHLKPLEQGQKDLKDAIDKLGDRFDGLVTALTKGKT